MEPTDDEEREESLEELNTQHTQRHPTPEKLEGEERLRKLNTDLVADHDEDTRF